MSIITMNNMRSDISHLKCFLVTPGFPFNENSSYEKDDTEPYECDQGCMYPLGLRTYNLKEEQG